MDSIRIQEDYGIDLSGDMQAMSRLREAAEKAKIELSGTGTTRLICFSSPCVMDSQNILTYRFQDRNSRN